MKLTEFSSKPRTLYVNRPLLNGDEIRAWAKSQGFESTLDTDDMHVTLAYSKEKFDWSMFEPVDTNLIIKGGDRKVEQFGGDATVLTFTSKKLEDRWSEFIDAGASWDYPSYIPHVTISYEATGLDVKKMEPYTGDFIFGPEDMHELNEEWADNIEEVSL